MSDIVYIWIGWLFDIESVVKRGVFIYSIFSFSLLAPFQTNACIDQTYYFRTKRFHVHAFLFTFVQNILPRNAIFTRNLPLGSRNDIWRFYFCSVNKQIFLSYILFNLFSLQFFTVIYTVIIIYTIERTIDYD